MGSVTTAIGLVIGKAVFKAWFKEHEFASSAGEGLIELVSNVIGDKRARSAAQRQLSRVAERAADANVKISAPIPVAHKIRESGIELDIFPARRPGTVGIRRMYYRNYARPF